MNSEQQLLHDIQNGSRGAQRRLYDCYAGYAMAIGMRYLADREAARDALQDAFVKILTRIDRFDYRGEGTLKAWIGRIVANEALTHLRDSQRMRFTDNIPDEPEEEEPDVGRVPLERLMQMIGDLPAGYRAVFNLYVFEQQSHREIAAALGISESTSASQLFRAKRQLAKRIKAYIKQANK